LEALPTAGACARLLAVVRPARLAHEHVQGERAGARARERGVRRVEQAQHRQGACAGRCRVTREAQKRALL